MRKFPIIVFIILVSLLLGFGGYAGYRFLTEGLTTPFTDIVMFVMALVGLLIALASFGIWVALRRILHEDLVKEISKAEEATRNEALSRMGAKVADALWMIYMAKGNKVFRDQALSMVKEARDTFEGRQRVEKEELKCRIYNNLAYAYAERGQTEDTAVAHYLTNYVKDRVQNFPDHEVAWLETYAYVLFKLPKKREDTEKALDAINKLLERPDIPSKMKEQVRKRYKIPNIKADQASSPDSEKI